MMDGYEVDAAIDTLVIAASLLVASLNIDDRDTFVTGFRSEVARWKERRMREPLPESYFEQMDLTMEGVLEGNLGRHAEPDTHDS